MWNSLQQNHQDPRSQEKVGEGEVKFWAKKKRVYKFCREGFFFDCGKRWQDYHLAREGTLHPRRPPKLNQQFWPAWGWGNVHQLWKEYEQHHDLVEWLDFGSTTKLIFIKLHIEENNSSSLFWVFFLLLTFIFQFQRLLYRSFEFFLFLLLVDVNHEFSKFERSLEFFCFLFLLRLLCLFLFFDVFCVWMNQILYVQAKVKETWNFILDILWSSWVVVPLDNQLLLLSRIRLMQLVCVVRKDKVIVFCCDKQSRNIGLFCMLYGVNIFNIKVILT